MVVRLGPVRSAQELIQPTQPPAPPRPQRKRSRSRLVGILSAAMTLIVVLGIIGIGGAVISHQQFNAPGPLATERVVQIPRDYGTEEIAQLLTREGVINQPTLFMIKVQIARWIEKQPALRAGEYQFRQQASLQSVIDTLTSGQALTHAVTIPEGLTSEQTVAKLNDYDFLVGAVADTPLEGSILPTTLRFERGTQRQTVIERLRRLQQAALKDVWDKRSPDLPLKSPQEMLILASIVEKETGKADERPRIAGVFINRLNRNMRLQSDPTTIYGLAGGKGSLGRPLSRADLDQVTAYNTYIIPGLPPGPIANPGRAALEAVANPSRTKELYFVADGSGGHVFSETLDQHNRNVVRLRQLENQREQLQQQQQQQGTPGDATPAPVTPPTQQKSEIVSPPAAVPQQATVQVQVPLPPRAIAGSGKASAGKGTPNAASAFAAVPALEVTGLEDLLGVEGAAAARTSRPLAPDTDDVVKKVDSWPVPERLRSHLPGSAGGALPELEKDVASATTAAPNAAAGARPKAFDASVGTKLDPLLNKSYDLSSAKTVPALR